MVLAAVCLKVCFSAHGVKATNVQIGEYYRGIFMLSWRAAVSNDFDLIQRIGEETHTSLPERQEVFEDKFRLFPEGSFVLAKGFSVFGYGISHPWKLFDIPPLDSFLGTLPNKPDCIFVHDVVVLPAGRGHRASDKFVALVADLARERDIHRLSLVSVYDTHPLWSRLGFKAETGTFLQPKLATYGKTARYMTLRLAL